MVMSAKNNSSPVRLLGYIMWMILFGLLSFQKCAAYDVTTSCPSPPLIDNTNVILSCFVNKTYINDASCGTSPSVSFYFASSKGSSNLCSSPYPNGSCGTLPTGNRPCGCTNDSGDVYTFQYNFTVIKASHENGNITCFVGCPPVNILYFHDANCSSLVVVKITTTTVTLPTTTVTLPTTTAAMNSTETTTKGSTPPTSISHSISSTVSSPSVTNITSTSGTTDHSQSECNNTTANCNRSDDKCPVWCIVVAVCVPCGGCGIIIAIVIIIKKKKAKTPGNSGIVESSERGYNGTKPAVQDTKEMQDRTKHHGTENRPKPAQGGSYRAEESVQDTKEMQDKTKHLGTENSPEREKRRKKKKKKKPFQEVDGETVSRENKSTVNDHKAAQNDNSVSVNENSPITYNGELRSLPMPKTPHLTSVERNSTIFQSETPRKLPPLQPKAMIIP